MLRELRVQLTLLEECVPLFQNDLLSLLGQMREARGNLRSLSERVRSTFCHVANVHMPQENFYRLRAEGATFKFQGNERFFGDVSEIMYSDFMVGSDGTRCWFYYSRGGSDGTEQGVRATPFEEMDEKNLSFCDPFGLQEMDVHEAAKTLNLEYMGRKIFEGRPCHRVQSTRVDLHRFGDQTRVRGYIRRWWIDGETLMPLSVETCGTTSWALSTFEYVRVNETMPDPEFHPPVASVMPPEPPEPLGEGYDTRFLNVMDGINGRMSVRWGKRGPKGVSSGGLN